jgi:hypothetical protein
MWHIKYKTELCTNFQNTGSCFMGERCTFAHGEAERREIEDNFQSDEGSQKSNPVKPQKIPCKYFALGVCKFGDKCMFSHEEPYQDGNDSFELVLSDQDPYATPPHYPVHTPPPLDPYHPAMMPMAPLPPAENEGDAEAEEEGPAQVSEEDQDYVTEWQFQAMIEGLDHFLIKPTSPCGLAQSLMLKRAKQLLAEKKFTELSCLMNTLMGKFQQPEEKQMVREILLNSVVVGVSALTTRMAQSI